MSAQHLVPTVLTVSSSFNSGFTFFNFAKPASVKLFGIVSIGSRRVARVQPFLTKAALLVTVACMASPAKLSSPIFRLL